MTELRQGPIGDRWVIVAPMRGRRPSDLVTVGKESTELSSDDCPFCPGNEDKTPPEIYRVSNPDGSWQVRVVPNKFPALSDDYRGLEQADAGGFYQRMNGLGTHEVIIENPDHEKGIPDLPLKSVETLIDTFAVRLQKLKQDDRYRYILLFENHGKAAGASLSHPHAQIIGIPIVPQAVMSELRQAHSYYEDKKNCLFCDLLKNELRSRERLIEETDEYVVFAPYASCFPFEITIMPKEHVHDFTEISQGQRREFAVILKRTLHRLKEVLNDPPYNLMMKSAPNVSEGSGNQDCFSAMQDSYHWRVEIVPRITVMAGLELATGLYVNPVPPEEAARYLKEAGN
jgi:UDPglucose--hexose-1-phosphate uridylyltransferase